MFRVISVTPLDDPNLNGIQINLISVVHKLLDSIAASAANTDVVNDQQVIMVKLFQCLEILYDNIDLTQNVNNGNEVSRETCDAHVWGSWPNAGCSQMCVLPISSSDSWMATEFL